ncbi:DUF2169 family type VI secretion system accessory protein [Aliidiomarina soli]|uniref:DUF2169 domain-containing protein n=1 Tax=Aliidiomarina soli TaxID=1928574 RepID=A0A432WJ49_9GAMM|nr:DUF2169 domain-containing protein [Aliidiomarina soli]RUO33727.1 hypothetical protein CWE14_04485 [Aliidiomarina soli]
MPVLVNESRLPALLLPGWSLDRRSQQTVIVKATCNFDLDGHLTLADQQPPLVLTDAYRDEPTASSLLQASEVGPFKQTAEFYLFGTAHPAHPDDTSTTTTVSLQGPDWQLRKTLLVVGQHRWKRGLTGLTRGPIEPLQPTALTYELTYGGMDPKTGTRLADNPAGRGYNPGGRLLNNTDAPCIEYESEFKANFSGGNRPAGYAPLPVQWAPRYRRLGEPLSEQALNQSVCPWGDAVDPRVHHCAPDDQQLPTFITGGEQLYLEGFFAGSQRSVELTLPSAFTQVRLYRQQATAETYTLACDTLLIDTDKKQLSLLYRAALPTQSVMMDANDGWLVVSPHVGPQFNESYDAN